MSNYEAKKLIKMVVGYYKAYKTAEEYGDYELIPLLEDRVEKGQN